MRQSPIYLAVGFLLSLAALPLTGCTLIGYAVGDTIDHGNLVPGTPVPSVTEMEEGDLYWVVKIDSSEVIGTYVRSFVDIPPPTPPEVVDPYDEVQKSYNQWRDADSSRRNMPRCLDSLEITLDTPVPRYLHGRLDRISTDSLWVVGYSTPRPPIRGISLREVRTLKSTTGGQIGGQDLRFKAAGMVLSSPTRLPPKKVAPKEATPTRPPRSCLLLLVDQSEYVVPVDSIVTVHDYHPASSTGATVGRIVGFCVDLAVIVGSAAVIRNNPNGF